MAEILYLTYTGLCEPLGQSQILAYLSQISRNSSYKFTIISFEFDETFEKHKDYISGICKESSIDWHALPYSKGSKAFDIFYRTKAIKAKIKDLLHHKKFEIVHCRSYRASEIGLWMKNKYGTKFIFDMRGFWADERIDGNIWNLKNPLHLLLFKYYKNLENKLLKNADHIVSLTENAANIIQKRRLKPNQLNIEVIPCCVDTNYFTPQLNKELLAKRRMDLKIKEDSIVISYLGSLGTWYLLNEMLAFFAAFKEKYANSIFMFITREDREMIFNAALKQGIKKEDLRVFSSTRNDVPDFLSISDYSLFFIKPCLSKAASSPVKQGEIMSMGIPLICNHGIGDSSEIILNYNSGILIEGFSNNEYQNKINELTSIHFSREKIREGAVDFFSLEKGSKKYLNIYNSLLSNA